MWPEQLSSLVKYAIHNCQSKGIHKIKRQSNVNCSYINGTRASRKLFYTGRLRQKVQTLLFHIPFLTEEVLYHVPSIDESAPYKSDRDPLCKPQRVSLGYKQSVIQSVLLYLFLQALVCQCFPGTLQGPAN